MWSPVSYDSFQRYVHSKAMSFDLKTQNRRLDTLRKLKEIQSPCFVTDITLQAIIENNLSLYEVFHNILNFSLNSDKIFFVIDHDAYSDNLYIEDGYLKLLIKFEQNATYLNDILYINKKIPASVAMGLENQEISKVVHHPAFIKTQKICNDVEWIEDKVMIHHELKSYTFEEALAIEKLALPGDEN